MHEVRIAPSAVRDLNDILHAIDDKLQAVTILRVLRRSERTYKGI